MNVVHRGTEVGQSVKPVVTSCWTNGHISDEDVNNFKAAYAIDFQKYGYSSEVPTPGYDQAPQVGMSEKEKWYTEETLALLLPPADIPPPPPHHQNPLLRREEANPPLENFSRSASGRPNSSAARKRKILPPKHFPPQSREPVKRKARTKPFESPILPRT